jgi:hypothetical protein
VTLFNKLKEIPNPPEVIEYDPNHGVQYVVYTYRSRLGELTTVVNECSGWVTVQPQKLPEGEEWYLTVMIPYGHTKNFQDRIWEEALQIVK